MNKRHRTAACHICKKHRPASELILGETIRPSIAALIKKQHPDWLPTSHICRPDFDHFRQEYIRQMLETEKGELSKLDKDVIRSLSKHEIISKNIESEFNQKASFANRLSDRIAGFGGSWKFITIFVAIIIVWVAVNTLALLARPFDPYPYILLNLVLSFVAALQAPIILMSQNRQEQRDRLRGIHDYKIDLKAELEIRHLHEKIDHLISNQWRRLLEIQQVQIEMLEEMKQKRKK